MKNMKEIDKYIRRLCLIIGIPILIFLLAFLWIFFNQKISHNISDWGNFGSYFGGILGAFISLGNLIIFVILTIKVTQLQDNNETRNREIQKVSILTQFRYDAIKEISIKLYSWIDNMAGNASVNGFHNAPILYTDAIRLEYYVSTFSKNNLHLFKNLDSSKIISDLKRFKIHFSSKENGEKESLGDITRDFNDDLSRFVTDLQQYTLDELEKTTGA